MSLDRRGFLELGARAAAAGLLAVPTGARAADGEMIVLSDRPANYEAPRSTFTTRVTPLERFYVRSHFDEPRLDVEAWRLVVGGQVGRKLELSLAELKKLPQTKVEAVLQCAGNGRALFRPRIPGVQWTRGAVANGEWTGVRLADLLARAGADRTAAHLVVRGADAPAMTTAPPFVRGLPLSKALHEDTLVALALNGAPLGPMHGAPARLVVPGWVGDDWIKWLTELTVSSAPPKGFFYETAYRFPKTPGAPGQPVPPAEMEPMTELVPKSIIGSVEPGATLAPGEHRVRGVAFGGTPAITRVELSVDGGKTWSACARERAARYGFTVFEYTWRAAPGRYALMSRATDAAGRTQPVEPVWNPSGYLYNALEAVDVEVRA